MRAVPRQRGRVDAGGRRGVTLAAPCLRAGRARTAAAVAVGAVAVAAVGALRSSPQLVRRRTRNDRKRWEAMGCIFAGRKGKPTLGAGRDTGRSSLLT